MWAIALPCIACAPDIGTRQRVVGLTTRFHAGCLPFSTLVLSHCAQMSTNTCSATRSTWLASGLAAAAPGSTYIFLTHIHNRLRARSHAKVIVICVVALPRSRALAIWVIAFIYTASTTAFLIFIFKIINMLYMRQIFFKYFTLCKTDYDSVCIKIIFDMFS